MIRFDESSLWIMTFVNSLILIQNLILVVLLTIPTWILCKGKKKAAVSTAPKSAISVPSPMPKSAVKPPDGTPSSAAAVTGESKEEVPKEGEGETAGNKSMKPFPKFEMPTESKKNAKIQENEADKKEKMKKGFFQEKSDNDDTLEKIESLRVEQSDKTKRAQKKKA